MRTSAVAVLIAVLLLAGGCGMTGEPTPAPIEPVPGVQRETNAVTGDSLALSVELTKRLFVVGENINLRIIARNTGEKKMAFASPTSAVYKVTIYRMASNGWRWVNQYPQTAMNVETAWDLPPGETVQHNQVIPVERDWPLEEPLKLVVELIGAPKVKCPIIISATAGK